MKWKSHTAIARAIAEEADIHGDLRQALYRGVVDPDRSPDYKRSKNGKNFRRMAHHNPSTSMIMEYVWDARYAYLKGDHVSAMSSIGRALHYVQDKSVSRGFRGWTHDWRESSIAKLDPPQNEVILAFKKAESSPEYVRFCITSVKGRKNAERAMRIATYYSSAIFAAVMTPPDNAGENRNKSLKQYESRKLLLFATLLIGAVSALLFLLGETYVGAAMAAIFILLLMTNRDYREIRRKASWYESRKF